ncbi:MAG: ABC-type spermidine/putrescine transport system, permease component II [Halorubrum sp. J07HR59]|jgi:ABC-type spermidine/putrescine transport system, permease component II|nr:MAG: ABC-type spermidine/putrescine transport system, permease component II [Candidatus Nanosalinarum sp. J07AB56]ERH04285.1 MAG: ABC-type spermidine/putrescine transport system, permease component II [Halorubrum sp. J07HR59]
MSDVGRWLFRGGYLAMLLFLVAPIVVVVGTSLNAAPAVTFPPDTVSTRWYAALLADADWTRAIGNSLVTATATSIFATALGVMGALGIRQLNSGLRTAVSGLAVVPLLVPGVVLGVTLLVFFSEFGVQQQPWTIVFAHSLWATPLTFSVMRATFSRFDWDLRDAANDLGAGPFRAFREVVGPNILPGLAAAALIAFVVSLQEFVMTLFLSGRNSRTVPVEAWFSLRNSLDPLVSVTSTLLVVAVLAMIAAGAAAVGLDRIASDT